MLSVIIGGLDDSLVSAKSLEATQEDDSLIELMRKTRRNRAPSRTESDYGMNNASKSAAQTSQQHYYEPHEWERYSAMGYHQK